MVFGTMLNIRETSMPTIETTMMGKCRQSCSYVNMAKPMYTKTKDSQPNAKTCVHQRHGQRHGRRNQDQAGPEQAGGGG